MRQSLGRGFSLVEIMVTVAILGILLAAGAPALADYAANSRLREAGHVLLGETLMAQSAAVQRNTRVRLSTTVGGLVQAHDMSDPGNPVLLRERSVTPSVVLPATSFTYGGDGRLTTTATISINLALSTAACSTELRCPGLRVDAGGPARLCANYLDSCV